MTQVSQRCDFVVFNNHNNGCYYPNDNDNDVLRLHLQHFFGIRVINIWNSLLDSVVSAPPVDSFKSRLDQFWASREVLYNFESEIRSEEDIEALCLCPTTHCLVLTIGKCMQLHNLTLQDHQQSTVKFKIESLTTDV